MRLTYSYIPSIQLVDRKEKWIWKLDEPGIFSLLDSLADGYCDEET